MKEKFYGDKNGYSGKLQAIPGEDYTVLDCPFCGGNELEIWNTHTPHYSVRCLCCGAECPSDEDVHGGGNIMNIRSAKILHLKALESAVNNWNKRSS